MNIVEDVLQKLGVKEKEIFTIDESRRLLMIDKAGDIWTPKCADNPTGEWEKFNIDLLKLLNNTSSLTRIPWLPHTGDPYYVLIDKKSVMTPRPYGWPNQTYLIVLRCSCWKNDILERAMYKMNMVFQTCEECKAARDALIERYPKVYDSVKGGSHAECMVEAVRGHETCSDWL